MHNENIETSSLVNLLQNKTKTMKQKQLNSQPKKSAHLLKSVILIKKTNKTITNIMSHEHVSADKFFIIS